MLEGPSLQPFLRDDFNGTEFASQILRDPRQSTPAKSNELQDAAHLLDDAIHLEVTSKQDDLLSHARQLQVSEQALQRIKGSISGLSDAAQRLKRDVRVPFDTVQQQVTQLGNLHDVMETLRLVNHHVKQTAKLRQLVKPGAALEAMDAAKAAKIVWEIEAAAAPATLAGIDIVDRRVPSYLRCACTNRKRTLVAAFTCRANSFIKHKLVQGFALRSRVQATCRTQRRRASYFWPGNPEPGGRGRRAASLIQPRNAARHRARLCDAAGGHRREELSKGARREAAKRNRCGRSGSWWRRWRPRCRQRHSTGARRAVGGCGRVYDVRAHGSRGHMAPAARGEQEARPADACCVCRCCAGVHSPRVLDTAAKHCYGFSDIA